MDNTFLNELLDTIGVSGFESEVCQAFADYVREHVDNVETDTIGNTIAIRKGNNPDSPTIMIEAHADEIGFQVLHIGESGYLYIRRNGGIDEQCLPGSQVVIQTLDGERIYGVIGKKPIHLQKTEERKSTVEIYHVWVDTGLPADEVRRRIAIASPVAFAPNMIRLGEHRIASRALDNRLGLFVVSQVIKHLANQQHQSDIYGVATVQEEVGSRGAVTVGYNINPDIAITIDLDFATDVPDCPPSRYGMVSLGGGVVIPRNADCNLSLSLQMEEIAKKNNIPYQLSARPHATGGTNTSRLQLSSKGIKTLSLGIPCRYMHTPVEVCDLRDVSSAINLLVDFCSNTGIMKDE